MEISVEIFVSKQNDQIAVFEQAKWSGRLFWNRQNVQIAHEILIIPVTKCDLQPIDQNRFAYVDTIFGNKRNKNALMVNLSFT